MLKRIVSLMTALFLLASSFCVSTAVFADDYTTFDMTITVDPDNKVVITVTVPEGIGSGRILFDVSEELVYVKGSLRSSINGTCNDSYDAGGYSGYNVSFASSTHYTAGAEVLYGEFMAVEGADITVDDVTVHLWNLTDGVVRLASEKNGGINKSVVKYYTVTFADYDGSVLKTETVEHGSGATAPTVSREGYNFTGWSKTFGNVTSNITVTAQYSIKTYTVTFADYDGSVLKTETVEHGSGATAPTVSREGYNFTGWSATFGNVTGNITVTAQYSIKTYTVTFADYDGSVLKTETVEHGSGATAPSAPVREGYTFTGWDNTFDNVTSNITVTAQYLADNIDVTFVIVGNGGSIVGSATVSVQNGTAFADISIPEVKTDSGYIFGGFDMPEGTVESATQISGKFYLKGDVNFDEEVDSLDAAQVLRYDVKSVDFDKVQLLVGDTNGDGEVDSLDAAAILKLDAGIIKNF